MWYITNNFKEITAMLPSWCFTADIKNVFVARNGYKLSMVKDDPKRVPLCIERRSNLLSRILLQSLRLMIWLFVYLETTLMIINSLRSMSLTCGRLQLRKPYKILPSLSQGTIPIWYIRLPELSISCQMAFNYVP